MDCNFIGWCALSQEAQAAWAQAILTVGTFAIASYYQWRASQKARIIAIEDKIKRSKAVALMILPEMQKTASAAKTLIANGLGQQSDSAFLQSFVDQKMNLGPFSAVSNELLDATESVQKAIYFTESLKELIKDMWATGTVQQSVQEALDYVLNSLLEHASEAQVELEKLFFE